MTLLANSTRTKLLNRLKNAEPQKEVISADSAGRYEPFAMTDMQQAYWLGRSSQMDGGNVAMHLYLEFQSDHYDIKRLEWALNTLIERHDMLHAVVLDSELQQVLSHFPKVHIELLDFTESRDQLDLFREEMAHRNSDLTSWPQNKVVVTKLSENEYHLHLSLDLWCIDGRSYQILLKELAFLYQNGCADGLRRPTLTFRDYVNYQQQRKSQAAVKAKSYWEQRLETLPSSPALPMRRGEEKAQGFQRFLTTLSVEETGRLKGYAQEYGVTLSSVLMTLYSLVLGKWSGESSFTLNIPRFNRPNVHPDVLHVIGEFATFSLLEVNLDPKLSFINQVKQLQHQLMKDMEHSSMSGMELLRSLTKKHGSVISMPVVFTASPELGQEQKQFEEDIAALGAIKHAISQTPQVDLDCQYFMLREQLNINWDALVHKFETNVITDMFAEFERLLKSICLTGSDWQQGLSASLPSLQQELWDEVNNTEAPFELVDWRAVLQQHALKCPNSIAMIYGDQTVTWSQLNQQVLTIAANIQAYCPSSSVVALHIPKSLEQIMTAYACVIAGCAYLPIDIEAPSERVSTILRESRADLLIEISDVNMAHDGITRIKLEDLLQDTGNVPSPVTVTEKHLAYVIYTSGSTGTPKGVPIQHQGLSNFANFNRKAFNLSSDDRVMALSAIHHDMSVFDLFSSLLAGAVLVVPDESMRRSPDHWLQLCISERITVWNSVPAAAQRLMVLANDEKVQLADLRLMILGGDWVARGTPEQLQHMAPNCQLYTVGGPTEISVWNIYSHVMSVDEDWASLPYGRPADNSGYLILSYDGELAPAWVAGEMLCMGTGVFDGYLHRSDLDQASFIDHPLYGRLYRTGDIGRLHPCGNFEFIGRTDNRVKLNGHRIELSEIEQLATEIDGIVQSVALIISSDQGDKLALCYLTESATNDDFEPHLKQYFKDKLPVALMPQVWFGVDKWPLTANNKINRQQLCEWCEQSGPEQTIIEGALAEMVAALWQSLIEAPVQYMSDNFFMLGADSITATRLASQIKSTFGIDVMLADIFLSPTIQQQTTLIGEKLVQVANSGR
ncbi:amino acid adenylation domain-containing protein [Vibrio caribbeanicus]|uniref:non-ribosomal peptide synthetase n=1 Tax=Vibrio caribbeanicus TaxID=701175 RepID=UPI0030DA6FB8